MDLCAKGVIPNGLLAEAQQLFEGDLKKETLVKYREVMAIVADVALVEPKYSDVADVLTDEQLVCIFDYTQKGVMALYPFREVKKLYAKFSSRRTDKEKTIGNIKGKK